MRRTAKAGKGGREKDSAHPVEHVDDPNRVLQVGNRDASECHMRPRTHLERCRDFGNRDFGNVGENHGSISREGSSRGERRLRQDTKEGRAFDRTCPSDIEEKDRMSEKSSVTFCCAPPSRVIAPVQDGVVQL